MATPIDAWEMRLWDRKQSKCSTPPVLLVCPLSVSGMCICTYFPPLCSPKLCPAKPRFTRVPQIHSMPPRCWLAARAEQ